MLCRRGDGSRDISAHLPSSRYHVGSCCRLFESFARRNVSKPFRGSRVVRQYAAMGRRLAALLSASTEGCSARLSVCKSMGSILVLRLLRTVMLSPKGTAVADFACKDAIRTHW